MPTTLTTLAPTTVADREAAELLERLASGAATQFDVDQLAARINELAEAAETAEGAGFEAGAEFAMRIFANRFGKLKKRRTNGGDWMIIADDLFLAAQEAADQVRGE